MPHPLQRIADPKVMVKVQGTLTMTWLLLIIPTVLWWQHSIVWVVFMSVWANIAAHGAAFLAAHGERRQQRKEDRR